MSKSRGENKAKMLACRHGSEILPRDYVRYGGSRRYSQGDCCNLIGSRCVPCQRDACRLHQCVGLFLFRDISELPVIRSFPSQRPTLSVIALIRVENNYACAWLACGFGSLITEPRFMSCRI